MTVNLQPEQNAQTDLLSEFQVDDPVIVATSQDTTVLKVTRSDGAPAALKLHEGAALAQFAANASFTQSLDGRGITKVYQHSDVALLMEWLDGLSLEHMLDHDREAAVIRHLTTTANIIHSTQTQTSPDYPTLETRCAPLFNLIFDSTCDATLRRNIRASQQLARQLLDTQNNVRPLHGNLTCASIRQGERGYCAFDANVVIGERAYELAAAVGELLEHEATANTPSRSRYTIRSVSQKFNVDPQRLTQWAAVHCALLVAQEHEIICSDVNADLLERLLEYSSSA